MATIVNLIDDHTSFLSATTFTGVGNWNGTNCTLQRTSKRRKTGPASLLITGTVNSATSTAYSHTSSNAVEIVGGNIYRGLCWFHHETVGRQIKFGVQFYDQTRTAISYTSDYYVTVGQGFDEWTLASIIITAPATARYASLRIDIDSVNTASTSDPYLWVEDAALVTYGTIQSRFLDRLSRWIPDWMILEDAAQTNPRFPMMRFIDLAGFQMDEIMDLISDFHYIPEVEGGPIGDTSSLVDPANFNNPASDMVTKPEWLPWLAQLVGARKRSLSIQTGTTWNYLETTYTTWTAWENTINSAANTAKTISTLSRTDGVVNITTSSAHGLSAGDVITVAGTAITSSTSADVPFNGYYEVTSASGSNLSYSQQYLVMSIVQSGTTTVTVTCGRPHGFVVGNTVTITDSQVASFNGTFTVTGVSTSGDDGTNVFTYTAASSATASTTWGTVRPATNKNGTGGTATAADLKWSYVEGANATGGADPNDILAEFIRTGCIGVWSGTIEGMTRAARVSLSGTDLVCSLDRVSGTITATTNTPHGFSAGNTVIIYSSSHPDVNRSYTVVSTTSLTFTVASGGTDFSDVRAWVTNKSVSITKGYWNGTISTVTVGSSNSYTVTLSQQFPAASMSGTAIISGSAASAVNKTHTMTTPTVSADRYTLTFTSNQATSAQSSAGGKIKIAVDSLCFVIGTAASQTIGEQTVIDFVSAAKPAGAVITQEYTA